MKLANDKNTSNNKSKTVQLTTLGVVASPNVLFREGH